MLFISTYFKKNFCQYFIILIMNFIGFILVILLFDIIDLTRMISKDRSEFYTILRLALMKNYSSLNKVSPMIILVSSFIYFYIKDRNNELIAAKSIGISNYGILFPIIVVTFIFGICNITIINSIGSMLVKRYHQYEVSHLKTSNSISPISKSGIWLKNTLNDKNIIIHASSFSVLSNTMYGIKILFINELGGLDHQIFANSMVLYNNYVFIKEPTILDYKLRITKKQEIVLPIKIDTLQVLEDFTNIESISILKLYRLIKSMKKSSLSATKYLLLFAKELTSPFYITSMTIVSFFFIDCTIYRDNFYLSSLYCLALGFAIIFGINFIYALGLSQNISIFLAVSSPVVITSIISLYLIIHKE